jgi:hypothetical protein
VIYMGKIHAVLGPNPSQADWLELALLAADQGGLSADKFQELAHGMGACDACLRVDCECPDCGAPCCEPCEESCRAQGMIDAEGGA